MSAVRLKIPATTANMGPGFDSIGMALSIYNYVEVREGTDNGRALAVNIKPAYSRGTLDWFRQPFLNIPTDETHLIYKTIRYFYENTAAGKTIPPLTITQEDYIPMTGGLGSSAACIVAGLLAANTITGGKLTKDKIIGMAARLDGHPDNTTPALAGGLTVGVMAGGRLTYGKVSGAWENRLKFALFIPAFTLPTEKARAVLPDTYTRQDAVFNASRAALLVTALISGDFTSLGDAMDDCIHQPYRQRLVSGMQQIIKEAKTLGAYNVFLSGAGSALIGVTEDAAFVDRMRPRLLGIPGDWSCGWVTPDFEGAAAEIL